MRCWNIIKNAYNNERKVKQAKPVIPDLIGNLVQPTRCPIKLDMTDFMYSSCLEQEWRLKWLNNTLLKYY